MFILYHKPRLCQGGAFCFEIEVNHLGKASGILRVAAAEVGYLEKASNAGLDSKTANAGSNNWTKYGKWYGLNGPEAYWCHMFISWCAAQSGNAGIIPRTASCYNGKDWFAERGRFHLRAAYTPRAGDVVYFSTRQYPNGGGHVGIVEKVENGYVYTIEGNTSGASGVVANGGGVARKSYPLGYPSIYGYGNPKYEQEEPDMTEAQTRAIAKEEANKMQPKRYRAVSDMPEYIRADMQVLIDEKVLTGKGGSEADKGLDLTEDMARMLIMMRRMID
jgi:hypothetical protein|nr:MAG TPA: PlyB like endolysin [Caudoviricetes sp.]